MSKIDAAALCSSFAERIQKITQDIQATEAASLDAAAARMADQIEKDRLVYIYGPGGHSNLSAQEVFFRAGGLMHVSAILDEGTLISNGALRSMAIERTPGYGKIVIEDQGLKEGDLLILVNAYGINSALIDAALEAKRRGVFLIGVSSRAHAEGTAPDHPARHPSGHNIFELVDIAVDCKVPIGDAVVQIPGFDEPVGAISTFANGFAMNCLTLRTIAKLVDRGITPPVWRSANAPGGDAANARFIDKFRNRVRGL